MASATKQFKAEAVFPVAQPPFVQFASRRSVVHSTKGMVACTQPLAAEAGQRILKMGGNAAVRIGHSQTLEPEAGWLMNSRP